MFSRISAAFVFASLSFSILAAATPGGSPPTTTTVTVTAPVPTATEPASQCNTSNLQCCNSVQQSDSLAGVAALALAGVALQGLSIPVGLTCSPLTVLGGGGSSCTQQPVCCENNNFNGAVALGCTPVNVNL